MPCYTPPPTREELNEMGELTKAQLEAVLCGILTTHSGLLVDLDYKEIGVPKKRVLKWWRKHQREDAQRRAREKDAQKQEALVAAAKSKLTPDELAALTKAKR